MTETHAPVLVRMTIQQKDQLLKYAKENGRTLTGEINERLQVSLGARGPTFQGILAREAARKNGKETEKVEPINDNGPASALSDTDRAMLAVFRAMPVEKQLALLSLFK